MALCSCKHDTFNVEGLYGKGAVKFMRLLIASDIHGSTFAARHLVGRIEAEKVDHVLLLGDLLYHGPRNALPTGYNPQECAELLNMNARVTTAVRGNCDSEVDQWMLHFPCMSDYTILISDDVTFFATHGHRPGLRPGDLPDLKPGSIFLYGHTHKKGFSQEGKILLVNPGSVAIPKDGVASYALYANGFIDLKTMQGEVIESCCVKM